MNGFQPTFHVARDARDRYQFDDGYFIYDGRALIANFLAARGFATTMNQRRDIANFPEQAVQPSQINAVALVQGIMRAILHSYLAPRPLLMQQALERLQTQLGADADRTLQRFLAEFPPLPVYDREITIADYLEGEYETRPNRERALEELLMLYLVNRNPAFSGFAELFSDAVLRQNTAYNRLTMELSRFFAEVARGDDLDDGFARGVSILDILLGSIGGSPHSLEEQLRYWGDHWVADLGIETSVYYRVLTAVDILLEEARPMYAPHFEPGGRDSVQVATYDAAAMEYEPENFTPDREWMPNLVMIAKNAYVWLEQLSRQYGREITTLDQIPEEEVAQLARWGITGLWLIGLWERSTASREIKVMSGNTDAVASAYSLYDYQIATRLGGDEACSVLREKAWRHGVRLASDMVPNHVGIDGKWVLEHPEWFVSLDYPPYNVYTFDGPDLSPDPKVGIFLEDHYFDRTDAAVVFKRVEKGTGEVRYLYHGNDGTSMPWNDTAQLDYLNPELREAMISLIIRIAQQFPIIRFDAAMTLVKKHVQRLWFPEPGKGATAIASRSEHGMTKADFDMRMPDEFWREVVDRAAVEAPDTLLLAEAFWLLEGYFVRTLGMHRVYNSAFMNMLRDEENAQYRQTIKNTLDFDPQILRRYVNFLNNPDEKTAVEQFGTSDKYFGVCMTMITMPGLPMFGHGQIEGFAEKYGMEYYRAYWDETPNAYLIQRHEREIFPLAKKRYLFAGVDNFLMYDLETPDGSIDENVFAYSNRFGDERSLVLYNNSARHVQGRIRVSIPFSIKVGDGDARQLVQRTVAEGLGLPTDENWFLIFREHKSGLEYIRECREIVTDGMSVDLNGYQYVILMDVRVVQDTPMRQYHEIAAYLNRRGVPSIDEALREVMVEPIRAPFRELVNAGTLRRLLEARGTQADVTAPLFDEIEAQAAQLHDALIKWTGQPVALSDYGVRTPFVLMGTLNGSTPADTLPDDEIDAEALMTLATDGDVIPPAALLAMRDDEQPEAFVTDQEAFTTETAPHALNSSIVDDLGETDGYAYTIDGQHVNPIDSIDEVAAQAEGEVVEPGVIADFDTEIDAAQMDSEGAAMQATPAGAIAPPVSALRRYLEAITQLPLTPPDAVASLADSIGEDSASVAGLYAWLIVQSLGTPAESRGWIDEWRLSRVITGLLREMGANDARANQLMNAIKLATTQRNQFAPAYDEEAAELLETLLGDTDTQALMRVNYFKNLLWFDRDGFRELAHWLLLIGQLHAVAHNDPAALEARYATLERLLDAESASRYQIEGLRAALRPQPVK